MTNTDSGIRAATDAPEMAAVDSPASPALLGPLFVQATQKLAWTKHAVLKLL